VAQRRPNLRIAQVRLALASRFAGGNRGQAALDVAVVPLDVASHQSLDGRAIVRVQLAAGFQMVGQALGFIERSRLEGGDKLGLVDQAVLKGEQPEKEMAVCGGGHKIAPIVGGRSREGPSLRCRPGN
jgi:hypothetical protein